MICIVLYHLIGTSSWGCCWLRRNSRHSGSIRCKNNRLERPSLDGCTISFIHVAAVCIQLCTCKQYPKFKGASFPQGKQILTLRTPGAGLGSCLSLPNICYNTSTFPIHFIRNSSAQVYEDSAYNVPRIFEAFCAQTKVLGIQANSVVDNNSVSNDLTPKCIVTGDGCISPNLRSPTTRVAIDFDGPTRGGGRRTQSTDVTILDAVSVQSNTADTYFTTKSVSQYNVNQDLQLFYREITPHEKKKLMSLMERSV